MATNEFIKKPHLEVEYTHEQIIELKRCADDPVYFISNYCYVQNQELGRVLFKLRPYQVRMVQNLHKNLFSIILCGRQAGKTETTAAFAYWFAIFHGDKNVLVASNKQKGASDIMNRIRFMYENTPDFLRPGVPFYNRGSIDFDNGSKIYSESTTETTGRGRAVALLIVDELAFVNRRIQTEMWASVLPAISSGKLRCVIMSTPNGDTDMFAELWRGAEAGTNGFSPIKVDIEEIPGRDEKWQQMMIAKLGEVRFLQEFKNQFLSSDALLINSLTLQRIETSAPIAVDRGFMFWKQLRADRTYIVSSDVAEGVQQDFSTVQVLELDTLEQVAEFRSNTIKEDQLYQAIKWICSKLLEARDPRTGKRATVYWSFENNSAGAAIGTLYFNDEKFPQDAELVNARGERLGFRTVNKPKVEACRTLKNLLEKVKGGLKINSAMLHTELKNYIVSGASYAAKKGSTDDLVSAMLIAMRIIKQLSSHEPEVFDKLYSSQDDFDQNSEYGDVEPVPFVM